MDLTVFDWEYYLEMYPDLVTKNITTKRAAMDHYLNYGKYDNRLINNKQIECDENVFKKIDNEPREHANIDYKTKISIVMTSLNRKTQILFTLKSFIQYSKKYNFEIIIVDDGSDVSIEDIKTRFFMLNIKIISISKEDKKGVNAVIAYNAGFKHATGDIIVIQNAEILHSGDVLQNVLKYVSNENYVVFPVFNSPNYQYNELLYKKMIENSKDLYQDFIAKINYDDFDFNYDFYINKYDDCKDMTYNDAMKHWYEIGMKQYRQCNESDVWYEKKVIKKWKGWLSHPEYNPRCFHFLTAVAKENLIKIGGFDESLCNNLINDDADFIIRMSYIVNEINILNPELCFGIHQYHADIREKYKRLFNEKMYVRGSNDLIKNGRGDRDRLWDHFLNYGYKEKRSNPFPNEEILNDCLRFMKMRNGEYEYSKKNVNVIKRSNIIEEKLIVEEIPILNKNVTPDKVFNYPKIMHLYWDGSPLSFMNFITVLSFNIYHKNWKIKVHMPIKKINAISWKTGEQKTKYNGKCYLKNLFELDNVEMHYVDFDKIGFDNNVSEVIKSDYFRYFILYKEGGLWSDFDIIYTSSIEEKMNFDGASCLFHCTDMDCKYYQIALLLSNPLSNIFKYLLDQTKNYYNKNNYQTLGATMFQNLFPTTDEIYKIDSNVVILDEDYYMHLPWNKIHILLLKKIHYLPKNNIGIHFFNGLDKIKTYMNNLEYRFENNFVSECFFDDIIYKYYLYYNKKNAFNISYSFKNTTSAKKTETNCHLKQTTFFLPFSGQTKKMEIILSRMVGFFKEQNVTLNLCIITNISISNEIIQFLNNNNALWSIENNLYSAIRKCRTDFILLQYLHIAFDLNLIKHWMACIDLYDLVLINDTIQPNKMDFFELDILKNKSPDLMFFKRNIIKTYPDCKFNIEYFNNNVNYFMHETFIELLFPKKIPKQIHFYWDASKACYLTNLAIKSFIFNNPKWEVNLWVPKLVCKKSVIWEKNEFIPPHSIEYNDHDYLDYELYKKLGINIRYIDYFDLGLKKNINEVLKSDIFRWKILSTEGGVWSDLDILFTNRIERTDFERYDFSYNEIECVVSEYSRNIEDTKIDFYYIGFLMSSPNNKFYKTMHEEALKNIDETKYQNVGGDLMKKHFGLYDDIKNVISDLKYANLESSSIYHYWWKDLREMFLNKTSQIDIFDYNLYHSNIVGYHWFRGVPLSKMYSLFLNYKNKIHNFDFLGPVPLWVERYKTIFNDFKENNNEKKISILMGYTNRLKQIDVTINTITKSKHKNYEIIIVNDCSDDLSFLKQKYDCDIQIINNEKKTYINPCATYNIGATYATGEIIILQNPECCHVGDLLSVVNAMLKPNDYLAFSAFYLDTYEKNNNLYKLLFDDKNDNNFWNVKKMETLLTFTNVNKKSVLPDKFQGWVSHHFYNRNFLHFCAAIYADDFKKIGGFSKEYENGICFDDDDLVRKVLLNRMKPNYFCIPSYPDEYHHLSDFSTYVIHQHHDRFEYSDLNIMDKWEINKNLFINSNGTYIKKYMDTFINEKLTNYDIKITNGKLIAFDEKNYIINFYETTNEISFAIEYEMEKFEYIFNGKSFLIKNDIVELFKNCSYSLSIFIKNTNKIVLNDVVLDGKEGVFDFHGKLNDGTIKFKNLPLNTILNFTCKITEVNFKDNTIFKRITSS